MVADTPMNTEAVMAPSRKKKKFTVVMGLIRLIDYPQGRKCGK